MAGEIEWSLPFSSTHAYPCSHVHLVPCPGAELARRSLRQHILPALWVLLLYPPAVVGRIICTPHAKKRTLSHTQKKNAAYFAAATWFTCILPVFLLMDVAAASAFSQSSRGIVLLTRAIPLHERTNGHTHAHAHVRTQTHTDTHRHTQTQTHHP